MDQGTIATLEAYCIRKTFEQAIAKNYRRRYSFLNGVLESYNIRHAIENIHHVWQQITANNMRGVWKCILPHVQTIVI
jgi:tetrahydromethanopterin S-methyltransferase subunit D